MSGSSTGKSLRASMCPCTRTTGWEPAVIWMSEAPSSTARSRSTSIESGTSDAACPAACWAATPEVGLVISTSPSIGSERPRLEGLQPAPEPGADRTTAHGPLRTARLPQFGGLHHPQITRCGEERDGCPADALAVVSLHPLRRERFMRFIQKAQQRLRGEESGFTLIKLLLLLINIGILLAIAVPSYLGFKQRA